MSIREQFKKGLDEAGVKHTDAFAGSMGSCWVEVRSLDMAGTAERVLKLCGCKIRGTVYQQPANKQQHGRCGTITERHDTWTVHGMF